MRCTQATLEALGIRGECPIYGVGVVQAIKKAGYRTRIVDETVDDYLQPVGLKTFIEQHQTGRYYVMSAGHAMALVNGVLTDTSERKISDRIKVVGAVEVL
jgi:hypothetical protein